jgi:hypothetical protein
MVELGGMADLTKGGWSRMSLKPGDMVTVEGWMARDGSKHVNARQVTTPAGATLMAASSLEAPAPGNRGQIVRPAVEVPGPTGTSGQLPATASPLFLLGAIGVASALGAIGVRALRR